MPEKVALLINGRAVEVEPGCTVAAALFQTGQSCRVSISGQQRSAFCGMGICFECRAVIDGVPYRRACQTICKNGMVVETLR